MLTIKSLAKSGHQVNDLRFFPRWKEDDASLQTEVLRSCDMNMMSLPFCHHGFGVKADGLTLKAWDAFGLERLMRVRQLAFVKHPFVLSLNGDIDESMCFDHSRGQHILDVMSVITLIAENNRDELEKAHKKALPLLQLAALTHDTLTPAGGDTIKMIDPDAFDEDARYHQLFSDMEGREQRHALCEEFGFHWPEVDKTVLNEGLFGQVLDMADKIGYVARDTRQFLDYCQAGESRKDFFTEFPLVANLVKADPWICGWWESVRVLEGRAWVEDGERLARFLKLRLRMFRGLYYHGQRTMDIVLPFVVTGFLLSRGKLTRDQLLHMSDEELERRIAQFCGVPHFNLRKVAPAQMAIETFEDMPLARLRERELIIKGTPFVHVEDIGAPLKPSYNKFYVSQPGERPQPFRQAFPKQARELDDLTKIEKPVRLCYFSENKLPKEHRKDLLRFRREQVGLDP